MADNRLGAGGGEMDHGRSQPVTLGVREDQRNACLHGCHQRVGGAEIDADDSAHAAMLPRVSLGAHAIFNCHLCRGRGTVRSWPGGTPKARSIDLSPNGPCCMVA